MQVYAAVFQDISLQNALTQNCERGNLYKSSICSGFVHDIIVYNTTQKFGISLANFNLRSATECHRMLQAKFAFWVPQHFFYGDTKRNHTHGFRINLDVREM